MMKTFEVECLEKFVVRTTYKVKANSKEQAIQQIKEGEVAYG